MSIKTFHIDSRGLVVEANGMDGTWVATSDYKALLATCSGTGQTITAQHDETGRLWRGPRGALPNRYSEIAYYDLPPCDCTGGVCVRGPRINQPPLGRRCRCDGELVMSDRVAELAVGEWEKNHSATLASERMHKAANELAIVAAINPPEIDKTELAKLAAQILALAWHVELGNST